MALLRRNATIAPDRGSSNPFTGGDPDPDTDAEEPAARSADPGDDDLLALAESRQAVLVSGDRHLLDLAGDFPVQTARTFLDALPQLSS